MNRTHGAAWISGWLCLSLAASASHAQSEAASAAAPDSVTPAPDSTAVEGKKKGGLFGKAKKFVGNKAVQQVAKTMACTMVPGGSAIAGAIDAASSKNVGEAAAGAAGAVGGQTCMPGGMAGMGMGAGGGVPGAGDLAGAAGIPGAAGLAETAGVIGAAGLEGAMAGMGGYGPGAVPEDGANDAMSYGSMPGMPSPEVMAACMGLTREEYLDFTDPTRGQARPVTKEEMKRQGKLARKIDMGRYQGCVMQQQATRMTPTTRAMVPSRSPVSGAASAEVMQSEASGKIVLLSSDLPADLAKGRTVVKDIDWLAGGGDVSEAGAEAFTGAMAKLAAAIAQAGGLYRADIYLDKRYDDAAVDAVGPARLEVVRAALEGAGVESGVVTSGKVKKDKNPRLEIVKVKK